MLVAHTRLMPIIIALPQLVASLRSWKAVLLAIAAGAISVLAMAPFFLWPVLFITFPVMIWLLDGVCFETDHSPDPIEKLRKKTFGAFLIGWGFGYGYFLASVYWIGYAFLVDSDRYVLAMPFAVAALPAGLALFYAAAATLAAMLWRRGYARIAAFAFAFFLAETARGYLLTGFPWNLFGQALAANDKSLQMAAYIGIYGLTLAALFIFSSPAAYLAPGNALFKRRAIPFIVAVALIGAGYGAGYLRLASASQSDTDIRIRIVQPNIPQKDRWRPENREAIFTGLLDLSKRGTDGTDIGQFSHVLWSEVAVPFLFAFNDGLLGEDARQRLRVLIPSQTTLLVGAERAEGFYQPDGRYIYQQVFNSLFVIGGGARIHAIYDKVHLVPFGEYLPLSDVLNWLGLHALSHQKSDFDAGTVTPVSISVPVGPSFSPLICYEIIFTGAVVDEKKRPGWIVNLTNDAWFGQSTGPYQHLHIAQIRAAEEGLPVMRSANTGISAAIDAYGRIVAKLDLGKTGVIDHALPKPLPKTFYSETRLPAFIVLFLFPLQIYLVMVCKLKES